MLLTLQLPIIALIFFFTINSTIASGIKQKSFLVFWKIRGTINEKRPLFFIALGFLFNFVYFILHIMSPDAAISNGDVKPHAFFIYSILLFNILNTYCFLIQSLPRLYFSRDETDDSSHPETISEIIVSWKGISYITVTLFSVALFLLSVFSWGDDNYPLYLFNFFGFLLISLYMFKLTSIHKYSLQNSYARYLILLGWLIWTLLQLWWPIALYFGLKGVVIAPIGFYASFMAKCLILLGLYIISVRTGRYAHEQLNTANIDLNHVNEKLKDNVIELNKTLESINSLPELIKSMSNSKGQDELSRKVVEHLTNKKVFDFDYAIFSEVNYLTQKIVYKDSITENDNIDHPENWVWSGGIPFDHHDIMAQVVKGKEIIHNRGEKLNNESIDITSETSPLNHEIYIKYNHQYLNRFFIPVLNLTESEQSENSVVAIIEVGYYIKDIDPDTKDPKLSDKIEKGELNIYLDGCAQSYRRLFEQEVQKRIDWLLKDCEDLSKDDHLGYLQAVLISTSTLIHANLGFIVLVPIHKTLQATDLIFEGGKIDENEKALIKSALIDCTKENSDSGGHLQINKSGLTDKLHKLFNIQSMQITDININNTAVGHLFLFGEKGDHFNSVVQTIITNITEKIGSAYNEKKFHNAVASLVTPDNAVTDLEKTMEPLIQMLKSYFETPYISIWLRNDSDEFAQSYASNELKSGCREFGAQALSVDKVNLEKEYEIIDLESSSTDVEYLLFQKYSNKNKLKTLLRKPIKTQHQHFGFINIYFKDRVSPLFYEEENFLNLISVKGLISIQIHNLVHAFREISDSFTQNDLNSTLQTITDSAMNLLNADPVILYKSNNGVEVFFNDVTYSNKGDFRNQEIIRLFQSEKNSHVELAERILRGRSEFFNNKSEYKNYINSHSKIYRKVYFEKDFWDRENIKSLAAIRLVHKTANYVKPVGVMFINFRNEVALNDDIRRVIETFAAFASGSIYNGLVFEQNRQFLLNNLRLTKPLLAEALIAGALHDANKTFNTIHSFYNRLIEKIDDPYDYDHKKMNKSSIRVELEKLKNPISRLEEHFFEIESLYAPAEKTVLQDQNINAILEQQLDIMEPELSKKFIHVVKEFPGKEIIIDCDESQIGLAILNILKNASQAMEKRGELAIRLNEIENSKIRIDIVDNGKGISDDIKDVMFQPNITDKVGGSGLGLSMSKYVIEVNHLGSIRGRTRDGRTTFTIILPIDHLKPNKEV
ncbi:MAG TPA: ATP-binding protein [Pyrinomonadaceae bacterium]|nr:ATP-binding protein [Pyrinomonadaceae bacterium]